MICCIDFSKRYLWWWSTMCGSSFHLLCMFLAFNLRIFISWLSLIEPHFLWTLSLRPFQIVLLYSHMCSLSSFAHVSAILSAVTFLLRALCHCFQAILMWPCRKCVQPISVWRWIAWLVVSPFLSSLWIVVCFPMWLTILSSISLGVFIFCCCLYSALSAVSRMVEAISD